jgi:hypothetical protein
MTPPATRETTPTTKRKRISPPAAAVTPGASVLYLTAALTAALHAATEAAAAEAAQANEGMDTETKESSDSLNNL